MKPLSIDSCIVCCQSSKDVHQHIEITSSEWKDWNVQRIIEKHLWWWYLKPPSGIEGDQWLCGGCWKELSSFHDFYIKVEKNNKLHEQIVPLAQNGEYHIMGTTNIKVEGINDDSILLFSENLVQLEKPKRGRNKKQTDKAADVQLEQPDFVQIEFENESSGSSEAKAELNIDICVKGETELLDWEQFFLNENDGNVNEEFQKAESEINELTLLQGRKIKAKPTTKCKQKDTKTKNRNINLNKTQTTSKYDRFIADCQFQLSCCICMVTLNNFTELKMHFRKEHNTLGYAMCCNKKFYKRGALVDHLHVHEDPEYFKCSECNKSLSCRISYVMHMEKHQLSQSSQNLLTCEKCDKSYLKKPAYDLHLLNHVPEEERNIQCSMCDKKFASEYHRNQHYSLKHLQQNSKICHICGKLLRGTTSFLRHIAEHKGENPSKVECDICGAKLKNNYRLKCHKRNMHTEENQQEQICPYCSKVSPNLNAHRRHVNYTHILQRKHACKMCDKKFRRPFELKEHMSTHTGEPLHICPHCPRTFSSNSNMHNHRKLAHRKEWEESRMKKEAKALAGIRFLKSLNATQNDTA